jgi:hypothetical protein
VTIAWQLENSNLGILTERLPVEINLLATSDVGPVTFSLIAGRLPKGLVLEGNTITGSAAEVKTFTVSKFVIRASDSADIEDRTFTLSVDGADAPAWITREGFLNVGQGKSYFVLDNAYVNYQLEAEDNDLVAGDVLEYYIGPMGGELPPGLTLTRDGRIVGYTDPIFSIESINKGSGAYDTAAFDTTPLDKLESRPNGFDTFLYDNFDYDYNEPSQTPRRLSRAYTFIVTVTDGRVESKQLFRMWVVTEEFLRSDNAIVQVDTNLFTADSSSTRFPLWITNSDLGRRRANNYLTVYLDVYQGPGLGGNIIYFLESLNPDGSNSQLPPGLTIDQTTGEIAGRVPYQSAVTKQYTFTVNAVNFLSEVLTSSYTLVGAWQSTVTYMINQAVVYDGFVYVCIEENRNKLPSESNIYWRSSVSASAKTFTISIIGEIESAITWITDSTLGYIEPAKSSMLVVEAQSLLYGNTVSYEIISGRLPPGLELLGSGYIQGKVKHFADSKGPGLTRFYEEDSSNNRNYSSIFDNMSTTFDRQFNFTVRARDASRFAQSDKNFQIIVSTTSNLEFSNLYVKAFQPKSNRNKWFNFITDANLFVPNDIYRYGDVNFGVQTEMKVLIYAGIESVEARKFVQAMSRNHYRKKLKFGDIKYSKAKDPATQETVYEVVYVEIVDNFAKNGVSIAPTIELSNSINSPVLVSYDAIKIDSDIPLVSDRDHQRIFPNSIKNMRARIKSLGIRDRDFLPLWMRTLQDNSSYQSGYVSVMPLCYTKPGKAQTIIDRIIVKTKMATRGQWLNSIDYVIEDSVMYQGAYWTCNRNNINKLPNKYPDYWTQNFNFNQLDFEVDRYLIDALDGEIENKYLAFPQIGEKLP